MISRVAFIGLGVMGYPMAGHLARAGLEVTVYNRTGAKAEAWVKEYGGRHAATPALAAEGADAVFLCVGNDQDLHQVTLGEDGAVSTLATGAVLVDHTTASATMARTLDDACREQGAHFIDAPVSGGQQGAENGQLSVMCGGEEAVFERVAPVLDHYGKSVVLMGPAGSGQLTKMANQICVGAAIQGVAEAIAFAQDAGLDAEKAMQVIGAGAGSSWQLLNRHQTMIADEYDHGFAVDWMRKDLMICLAEANRTGTPLPVTAQINEFYKDIQAMGGGRWDTSSLLRRLRRRD
ncbi:NAD(P)-dependent oxidoreductase [Alloalcanivorax xenomutans]|jgi:3-hydroxyisobutyrate dehydrogenase-like beta-hydroxyacid dehydrogenase|uniref:NAD(P)-dependent oxidoreductase n=1 Tax=Alloalcanivorax xenomutans TaxID=1094342 RepID=UPI00047B176B|nr:NAD(P)-dependent oxidoreductase [Alloalcanivorax xenomutans]KYZ85139.1 oxidoreductase [Alcanivorax sp. KX64203]MBA4721359.1 NAD(P)-dependent oxidoreductase [Alcanivorax sp.]PHS67100.1 MAG: NAD(P)-dependent oxidoreductase [Alcanivorax sp.]WOA29856.1 NAD(P)-dependent oxidoreductase [Alloalcanivorax xenomutans]WOD26805.1 NAD(P)-dependent oxidoreductase [Alloalcanivorax xenomutans]